MRSPRFRHYNDDNNRLKYTKNTPVLQAKIKQHSDDGGPLEIIAKAKNIFKKSSQLAEGRVMDKPACANLVKIATHLRKISGLDASVYMIRFQYVCGVTENKGYNWKLLLDSLACRIWKQLSISAPASHV